MASVSVLFATEQDLQAEFAAFLPRKRRKVPSPPRTFHSATATAPRPVAVPVKPTVQVAGRVELPVNYR